MNLILKNKDIIMRKILLPTDFSENAFNALKYAVELFKYEKSEFILLHAYADEVYNNGTLVSEEIFEELKTAAERISRSQLDMILNKIKELSPNPKHSFTTIAAFGALVDEANEIINQENIDLAVMGTRGKTNDRQLTFGTNTIQVIKYVQSPVLCIPEDYNYKTPKQILFPTNFLIPYQRRELKLLADLARSYRSEIHMLYISNFPIKSYRQKDNQMFLKEEFADDIFNFHRVPEGEKTKVILDHIDSMKIDMLVMVRSRHTYLENIIQESTVDKIGLHPKIPFLVFQNYYRAIL
mgnify:CR=1 FL=1